VCNQFSLTRGTGACQILERVRQIRLFPTHQVLRVMSQPKRVQTSSKEGNLLLAISAFQSGQCASINAAAKLYDVVPKSLYRRINGGTSREDYTLTNKRLSNLPCGFLRSCFEHCIPYCMPLNDRKIMGIYYPIEDDAEKIIMLFSLLYDCLGSFKYWVES